MKAPKPEGNADFELTPAGTNIGILYKIIYLGTHEEEFEGKSKEVQKVRLYWELPNEIKSYEKDGQTVEAPFAISRELTFSMGEKANLRKLVQGMIGTTLADAEAYEFDLDSLLGSACLLTVVHQKSKASGNEYAMVSGTAPLMKGMEKPKQFNKSEILDVHTMTEAEIAAQPEWLAEKLRQSKQYSQKGGGSVLPTYDKPEEDLPTPF